MNLKERISEDLKAAMKAKNAVKLSILRVLKGEIERNEQTPNGKIELLDGDVIKIVKKLVDSIKNTTDNTLEILALDVYLPRQLSEEQMRDIVFLLDTKDMGAIMKHFKTVYDGCYDGKLLSTIAKENI